MSLLINDLQVFLLNISFIFILFFIYLKFVEGKINRVTHEILIGLISGISIILCMTFTIKVTTGHIFDLRQIPFIIGALYGGRRVSLFLFVTLITYRFSIEGSGFYGALLVNSLLLICLWFLIPNFSEANTVKQKVRISAFLSLIGILFMVVLSFSFFPELNNIRYTTFLSFFLLAQFSGIILFVNFIEKARYDMAILHELRKLEKLKIVSEIAASISHEVRNPLTVTRGFIQLLKDPDLTKEKKNEYIKISLEELDRAERIITDYLTFAKPSLENVELLELNEELAYVIKVITPYATMKDVDIQMKQTKDIQILGERQRLHQCLINIAKNGIEAMESGGQLSIELSDSDKTAVITISDTGVGMNEEQLNRLGTPYYSTKEKGTGLGTMVVYSIVKAMEGNIEVASELGKGTRFSISLPTFHLTNDRN